MGTPFQNIYNLFLSQIKDYELAQLAITDKEALKENLQLWLMSSLLYFQICKKDLEDYDLTLAEFNEELSIIEQTILAKYMTLSYINTYLIREENLAQALNSKDYRMYSPANQLKALELISERIRRENSTLQSQYSWNIRSLKGMFKS